MVSAEDAAVSVSSRALGDRVSADLAEYESAQERRQRSYAGYEREATANVCNKLADDGMEGVEITALLLTGEGQDLVEAEVTRLEEAADDADVDRRIDEYRDRHI